MTNEEKRKRMKKDKTRSIKYYKGKIKVNENDEKEVRKTTKR